MKGNVFYVGKGTSDRAYKKGRNRKWKEYIGDNDYIVDIPYDNLTEEEALDLEALLIKLYGFENLTNLINETPKSESTIYYDIAQKINDLEVLTTIDDKALQNDFIREQLHLIGFIEGLRDEIQTELSLLNS